MSDDDTILEVRRGARPRCGPYELVREVGRGGMGAVWEGRHASLGRRVAVKVLHPQFTSNPELLARFLREGMAAARVEHPHVATVFDVGQDGARAWLAMEFLDGEDLGALLLREGRIDATRAVDVLLPVLAAVSAAHAAGVMHRYLKPGNIFLSRDRAGLLAPKVVDFGFSKVRADDPADDADLTRPQMALGTLAYMPLEQVRAAREAGPACDQYALGITLYRAVTGQLPYDGVTPPETFKAIVRAVCPRPSELAPALPSGLDDVILRAMKREPHDRFPTVREFGAALLPYASPTARARWAETFGVVETAPAEVSRSTPPIVAASTVAAPGATRPRWTIAAAVAGLLAVVALIALLAAR